MMFHFRPPLIKIINIIEEKGYYVVPNKIKDKYIANIYFNGELLKKGTIIYETHLDCLKASYEKLYDIYK